MRNLFFKKAAFGAASLLSFATPQAMAETKPEVSRRETFTSFAVGEHTIYAKAETLRSGEGIFPHMIETAQKDLLVIEPSRFEKRDIDAFISLAPVKRAYRPVGLLKTARGPNGDWAREFNNNLLRSNDAAKRRYFESVYAKAAEYRAGANYSAGRMTDMKTCVILGDLNASPQDIGKKHGSIPQILINEAFEKKFSDRKSLMTLIMLHEAAHCGQRGFDKSEGEEWQSVTLKGELQADRVALAKYKALLASGEDLDPDLPENFGYMRLVAPFMLAEGDLFSSLTGLAHDHATGMGLIDTTSDETIYSETSQAVLIGKALTLRIADREDIDRLRPLATMNVDANIARYLEEQKKFFIWMSGKYVHNETLDHMLTQVGNRILRMRLVGIELTLADMLQKENPQYMYQALEIMATHGWQEENNKNAQAMAKIARNVLLAWSGLALHKEEFDLRNLEWNLALEDGEKLTVQHLPLVTHYRSMKNDMQSQEESVTLIKTSPAPKPL